jgi:hypothetical protein
MSPSASWKRSGPRVAYPDLASRRARLKARSVVMNRCSIGAISFVGSATVWHSLSMASVASAELRMGVGPLINDLLEHIDGMAADGRAIPQVDGASWRFSSRQFRRTLAWHIANRPQDPVRSVNSTTVLRTMSRP